MNIKQKIVDTTSTSLSLIALVGGLALGQPAKADDGVKNILTSLALSYIITEVFYGDEDLDQNQDIWGKEHNPINERHRPGYARGGNNPMKVCATRVIRHTGNVVEQVKVNCYGQVISSKIIRR